MQAIYILWLRQIKRYLRSRARIVGSIGQPLLFLVALGFGLGPVFQKAGQGNYLEFLSPGVIAMGILFTAIFSGIEIIWDRQFGFLKETLVAPVSRLEIMIGRTLGGATVALLQGLIIFLITIPSGNCACNLFPKSSFDIKPLIWKTASSDSLSAPSFNARLKLILGRGLNPCDIMSGISARRAARSKPRRVASRSTRVANSLGTSSVSFCAALSIAAE